MLAEFMTAVDSESRSFAFGQFIGRTAPIVIGIVFVVRGLRRRDKTRGGWMTPVGSVLLALGIFALVLQSIPNSSTYNSAFNSKLADAHRHLESKDMTIDGKLSQAGESIRYKVAHSGDDSSGKIKTGGITVAFRRVGSTAFFQMSKTMLRAEIAGDKSLTEGLSKSEVDDYVDTVAGSWSRSDEASPATQKALNQLAQRALVADPFPKRGQFRRLPSKTVRGVDCVGMEGLDDLTIYLAKTDSRPMRIIDGEGNTYDFNWDPVKSPTKPRKNQMINSVLDAAGYVVDD